MFISDKDLKKKKEKRENSIKKNIIFMLKFLHNNTHLTINSHYCTGGTISRRSTRLPVRHSIFYNVDGN